MAYDRDDKDNGAMLNECLTMLEREQKIRGLKDKIIESHCRSLVAAREAIESMKRQIEVQDETISMLREQITLKELVR